jgi:integrase
MRAGKVIRWTLAEVLDRYIADISPTKASADKEALRLRAVQRSDIGSMVMQDITPADLAAWRDLRLRCVKPASVLREIGSLRAVWRQAKKGEWGYVDHDPWPEVTKPSASPPRETVFLDGQAERIVEALGYAGGTPSNRRQEAAIALLLSLETAMRAGEIVAMRWEHVALEKRIVRLPKTKNGDAREVPLSRRAIELIKSMRGRDEERVFTLTSALLDAYYRQGRELAGIEGPTFHDARATALTRLSKRLDILELAKMVGHRDPRSLMIYYRQSATEIAAKLD